MKFIKIMAVILFIGLAYGLFTLLKKVNLFDFGVGVVLFLVLAVTVRTVAIMRREQFG